ncbi:NAD(P)-binding protein [Streptomyces sp. NPDC002870]|uniref:NAD(P)-binding protein n=1 Tax=Streptomyces sp. NPDC002870 TaxID=3364666 RepID=UPI00369CCE70
MDGCPVLTFPFRHPRKPTRRTEHGTRRPHPGRGERERGPRFTETQHVQSTQGSGGGAGIAGLSAARALGRRGKSVEIVECRSQPAGPVPAGNPLGAGAGPQ